MELDHSNFFDSTGNMLQGLLKFPEMASAADLAMHRPFVHPGQANGRV